MTIGRNKEECVKERERGREGGRERGKSGKQKNDE